MSDQKKVRTRIAPSPTGFPHIGTLYQSLFDYAWAKRNNGQFLIRIEDTDRARFVEGAEEVIFEAHDWMGLSEDESSRKEGEFGPYRQSERLDIYKKYAEELIEKGHAYYCFCTKERLEKLRKDQMDNKQPPMYDRQCESLSSEEVAQKREAGEEHVVRMKIPRGEKITVHDGVRGDIEFDTSTIDDQVIMKSDGFPTYHLAVVVDDHLMKITDVIRGEEWVSSLPKHTLLYQYFGWEMPNHWHTAILRNPDKSKMGKRHGHTSVTWYQENGFLPEAVRNFLALLGWSHPDEKEVFSLDEFVQHFHPKDMKSVGPIFDVTKLEWLNGEYIRLMSEQELTERLYNFYQKHSDGEYSKELIAKTVPLVQTRIKTLREFDDYCRFFIQQPEEYEKDISGNGDIFNAIVLALQGIDNWKADAIGEALQKVAQDKDMGFGKFFMLVRIALTGKKVTPPTNESMEILGKDECIRRFKNVK